MINNNNKKLRQGFLFFVSFYWIFLGAYIAYCMGLYNAYEQNTAERRIIFVITSSHLSLKTSWPSLPAPPPSHVRLSSPFSTAFSLGSSSSLAGRVSFSFSTLHVSSRPRSSGWGLGVPAIGVPAPSGDLRAHGRFNSPVQCTKEEEMITIWTLFGPCIYLLVITKIKIIEFEYHLQGFSTI